MRVLISADMEGIAGVVHHAQTTEGPDYERSRRLMTREVNAAVEGALAGGATEVIVADSHMFGRNVLIEELHPRAELLSGLTRPLGMLEGVQGARLVFFVGYHGRSGTQDAILDHTYSGRTVDRIVVNGEELSEAGLGAALAGEHGAAVGLITGDRTTVEQARAWLGDAEAVAVKEAIGRYSARSLPLPTVHEAIRSAAERAVRRADSLRPFVIPPPTEWRLKFTSSGMADLAELVPSVQRLDAREVSWTAPSVVEGFKLFRALLLLASTALPYVSR